MSRFFVFRPVFAIVLSIVIVALGLLAMQSLPVAQYPNIVPPMVQVSATFPGADALSVEEAVAAPIEQQVTGVDGMLYMQSLNAGNGMMNLQVTFELDTNSNDDQSATNIRLQNALSQLPDSVQAQGLVVRQAGTLPLMFIALYSPDGSVSPEYIANYAYIYVNDPLTRVYGVGQVNIYGLGGYAMRIWMRPELMATFGVQASDLRAAILAQSTITPAGRLGAEPAPPGQAFTLSVLTQGRAKTPEEFGDIIVKAREDGSLVRIRDVARVEQGAATYDHYDVIDGKPATILAIMQAPDTNSVQCSKAVRAKLAELATRFPPGIAVDVGLDTTAAVTAGVDEIIETLWIALGLAILVVFVFLQSWRATLIPLVAVPVSLIGAFVVFVPLGFSINTLSLFGLVLAIGLVVDDAIIVVEAVERNMERGLAPREATLAAMKQVASPVVATALILAAVFIPAALMPGITGELYQQFALAIAVSVAISAFNALTLSPALCALILKPKGEKLRLGERVFAPFNRAFERMTGRFVGVCRFLVRKLVVALVALAALTAGAAVLGKRLPPSFIPTEDQGYFFVGYQLPAAASVQRTAEVSTQIDELLKDLPGVSKRFNIWGYDFIAQVPMTNAGFVVFTLKPWAERTTPELSVDGLMATVRRQLGAKIPGAFTFVFPPPAIPGIGQSGGVSLMLQDLSGRSPEYLAEQTARFVEAATKEPEVAMLHSVWVPSVPKRRLEVDRAKARKLGVAIEDVDQSIAAAIGSSYVNLFNRFGRTWQVYLQAEPGARDQEEDLQRFYVRNAEGGMVPLTTVASWSDVEGPEFTTRVNEYRAAQLVGQATPGISSGEIMDKLEEVAARVLPSDMSLMWWGMSYQEDVARKGTSPLFVFGLSLFFVFLILAAQYESWSLPLAVLFCTPVAALGAIGALVLRGYDNDVYAQIGLVVLVGLSAKNAILIVEFAKSRYDEGMDLYEATLEGARLRLRPILMTAFAFIAGTVPLAIATGSGAIGRRILGSTVIGGMLAAALVAVFLIPASFVVVMRLFRVKRRDRSAAERASVPVPASAPAGAGASGSHGGGEP